MVGTEKLDAVDEAEESDPLLGSAGHGFTYNVAVFLVVFVLYFTGSMAFFYIVVEWIHHYEQARIMPNGTLTNSSSDCGSMNLTDADQELYDRVDSETAKWQMYNNIATNLPAVITTSFLPAYSDCFGRRFILIVGSTGTMLKFIISTFVIYFNWHPLFAILAAVIEGCSGGYFSVVSGGYSYMADITEAGKQRTFALTFFDGASMACICVSGIGTGYFVQYSGYFIPTVTSCGMVACSYILIVFVVPETFPKHMRSTSRAPWTILKRTFSFYFSDIFKAKRTAYLLLITAYILENFTSGPRADLELLYQLGQPFCWSTAKIGIFSALRHLGQGLAGMFILKPLQHCFSDLTIAILSMLFGSGSYVLEGLARTDLMLYLVPTLAAFAFLCESMIKGIMSTITPPDKQGSLFSSIVMIQVLVYVVANFTFNTIYSHTVSFMSGFIFLLQAGICMLTITFLAIFGTTSKKMLQVEKEKLVNNTHV